MQIIQRNLHNTHADAGFWKFCLFDAIVFCVHRILHGVFVQIFAPSFSHPPILTRRNNTIIESQKYASCIHVYGIWWRRNDSYCILNMFPIPFASSRARKHLHDFYFKSILLCSLLRLNSILPRFHFSTPSNTDNNRKTRNKIIQLHTNTLLYQCSQSNPIQSNAKHEFPLWRCENAACDIFPRLTATKATTTRTAVAPLAFLLFNGQLLCIHQMKEYIVKLSSRQTDTKQSK